MPKLTKDDLKVAEKWLRNDIDCAGSDHHSPHETEALQRVVDWMRNEIGRREDAAYHRSIARQLGGNVSPAWVRAKLRQQKEIENL